MVETIWILSCMEMGKCQHQDTYSKVYWSHKRYPWCFWVHRRTDYEYVSRCWHLPISIQERIQIVSTILDWLNYPIFGFDPKTTKYATNNTPDGYPLLNKYENVPSRKASWKYHGIIGMLEYLQGTTRPEITMTTHQWARFNNDPHLSHERAVKLIIRYLLDNRNKGMIYIPDTLRGLECYIDADFVGGRKYGDNNSPKSVLSRKGFVIMYDGCPIH